MRRANHDTDRGFSRHLRLAAWRSQVLQGGLAAGWIALTLLVVLSGDRNVALAQQPAENSHVGKRVITQFGTVLKVGNQVVDDEGRSKELARGKNQSVFRTYKVEQANGQWLWLVAEGSSVKGWAPAANVILIDRAIDYITRQIDANPGDSTKYVWRANVWLERKEFDIAIADFNEAIRLDHGSAGVAYQGRSRAWRDKEDYDKAIADCNEAIRLDPGYARAYYTRGVVWSAKKDSKLTREPKQIDAQLAKQTGAELSALFVKRCLVSLSGLCRPVWNSRMTKPAKDRVAGEFNPAGRLTGPCDNFFN